MLSARFDIRNFTLSRLTIFVSIAIITSACVANNANTASEPVGVLRPSADALFGERNPNGPAELAQFEFVIGDWDVDLTQFPRMGEPVSNKARWRNVWIADGFVVLQEWRGPYISGAELRAWDVEKQHWVGENIYAGSNWRSTHAHFIDGEMVVYNEDALDAGGAFINRETYYDIWPDSFKIRSEKSYDQGGTWVRGNYEMTANRIRN